MIIDGDDHYPIWRNIGWLEDGDTEYAEIKVCGLDVPKHSHFPSREDVPEWPCEAVRAFLGRTAQERNVELAGGT